MRTRTLAGSPDLAWLADVLWGTSGHEASTHAPVNGSRLVEAFAVLPTASRPRLLLPLGAPQAAAEALRAYPVRKAALRRLKPVLACAAQLGLGERIWRDRLYVAAGAHADGAPSLTGHLRSVFGERVEFAFVVNPARPHKKPTIQVLSTDGDVIAYVKVGWNDVTRSLVRNEARVLARLERHSSSRLRVPRVLHGESWRGLELLVVESFSSAGDARRRDIDSVPVAATKEVVDVSPVETGRLRDSGYFDAITTRLDRVERRLGAPASFLRDVARRIDERAGDLFLRFSLWHGDWVPWNMAYFGDELCVWDWERGGSGVPAGLDAVHFDFQVRLNLHRAPPHEAVRGTLAAAPRTLEELGLDGGLTGLLLDLHLLEMALRFQEAQAAGVDTVDRKYLPLLEQLRAPA